MSYAAIFLNEDYEAKPVYVVEGEPFHHMVRVMRMVPMIVSTWSFKTK